MHYFLLILCLCIICSGQPSLDSCSEYYDYTSELSAISTAKAWVLSIPPTIQVQAQNGSAWSITMFGSSLPNGFLFGSISLSNNVGYATLSTSGTAHPTSAYTSTGAPTNQGVPTLNGFPTIPTDGGTGPGTPTSSSRHPVSLALLLCSLLFVFGLSRIQTRYTLFITLAVILLLVPATSALVYWCASGTLVITYPPGANLIVNGNPIVTCSIPSTPGTGAVQTPTLKFAPIETGRTFWFSSPIVIDLDRDTACTSNCNEIITCGGSRCDVYSSTGSFLVSVNLQARNLASPILKDIDNNGFLDLCVGHSTSVSCWEFTSSTAVQIKSGFPQTVLARNSPREVIAVAAEDFDKTGQYTVVAGTTDPKTNLYAFDASGNLRTGWPRWNTDTSNNINDDADGNPGRNGNGVPSQYASYGLNVGIGNLDDDYFPEIGSSFDNHQYNVYKETGMSLNCGSTQKNCHAASGQRNNSLTWAQKTATWANYTTDTNFWTNGCGDPCYPYPYGGGDACNGGDPVDGCNGQIGDHWFQFTHSPTHFNDIDGDGQNEFIVVGQTEVGGDSTCGGYATQFLTLLVLQGNYGNGGSAIATAHNGCLRKVNFTGYPYFPQSGNTIACKICQTEACDTNTTCIKDLYFPPKGVPAIAFADVLGYSSSKKQMIFGFDDGRIVCYDHAGSFIWGFDYESNIGANRQQYYVGNSEVAVADLNGDGKPEVIFHVFGHPSSIAGANQWLFIINGQTGAFILKIDMNSATTNPGGSLNGNGYGAFGAPTIADVDGDGQLEILSCMVDGRIVVHTVPGSQTNCIQWFTGRGGYLRKGQPDGGNY